MRRKLFREIRDGECKESYLSYIESICRIDCGRRAYGSGPYRFAVLKWGLYHPKDPMVKGGKYIIHHKDFNSLNDSLSNLVKMTRSAHQSLHGSNRSKETKRKNSEAHKGNKNCLGKKNANKPVIADGIKYPSGREAAKALGVVPITIIRRIKSQKSGYYYL